MNYIEVFSVGTPVIIGPDIKAVVLGSDYGVQGVRYNVAWWDGAEHKMEWLYECEVKAINGNERDVRIGFKPPGVVTS